MMSKQMEGPVQVLTPQALPIKIQRGVYRQSNLGRVVGPEIAKDAMGAPAAVSSSRWEIPVKRGMNAGALGGGGGGGGGFGSSALAASLHESSAVAGRAMAAVRFPDPGSVPASSSLARCQRHNLRRIFVQTETGAVVVVEVDCARGGAEKVKRSVQEALNVPTEQTELMLGGQVLEDLHSVQNDVPVLLRRGITRSASTPCLARSTSLSPPSDSAGVPTPSASSFGSVSLAPAPASCAQCDAGGCSVNAASGTGPQQVSALFEIVGGVRPCAYLQVLIQEAMQGVRSGVEPRAASGGTGGAYCFRNANGKEVVIVKPTDEEPFAPNNPNGYVGRSLGQPGLKKAIRVGEAGLREVAAYLLDHDSFAGVPYTALVRAAHPVFNVNVGDVSVTKGVRSGSVPEETGTFGGLSKLCGGLSKSISGSHASGSAAGWMAAGGPVGGTTIPSKLCSLQQYVQHDFDSSECGFSRFPVSAVHRIGILDVRIFNTDRHSGNILVRKLGQEMFERRHVNPVLRVDAAVQLIPIDHGFCLPETLEAAYFEWLHWPQASLPFSEDELEYIASLDAHAEVQMLKERLPMLREGCLRMLILSTTLLQRGAAAGLTLADIGSIMSREVRGMEEVTSDLETLCLQAMKLVQSPPPPPPALPSAAAGLQQLLSDDLPEHSSPCWSFPVDESPCSSPRDGGSSGCTSPNSDGKGERCWRKETDPPGLFFDLDEGGLEEERGVVQVQSSPLSSRGMVPTLRTPPGMLRDRLDSCMSPRWPFMRLNKGAHHARERPGPPAAAMKLEFGAPPSPHTSPLSKALSHSSGMAAHGDPALLSSGAPLDKKAVPSSGRKAVCRHESLLARRFRQCGPFQANQPSGQSSLPNGPSGLKLGSAGALGTRLNGLRGHSTEMDIDGALPGGASFLLSDMAESTWEVFFEIYVDLVDELVIKKVAERGQGVDVLCTSCQW